METTWLACNLRRGTIHAELPLSVSRVRSVLASEESASWSVPAADPSCPREWAEMTVPGRDMLVCCFDGRPVQAWAITGSNVGSGGATLRGITLEHCLARVNVATMSSGSYSDEHAVWAGLAARMSSTESFGFLARPSSPGAHPLVLPDVEYDTEEDMSVLEAVRQRSAPDGGYWWRIDLERVGDRITKTLWWDDQTPPRRPDAVFGLDQSGRGNISSYARDVDYGPSAGATRVRGVAPGAGDWRPMTDPLDSTLVTPFETSDWPRWEARVNFDSVNDPDVANPDAELLRLARAELARRERGLITWQVTGDEAAPRPGLDFDAGDTVYLDIAPQLPVDPVGSSGRIPARVAGWELDTLSGAVTLIMWEEPA